MQNTWISYQEMFKALNSARHTEREYQISIFPTYKPNTTIKCPDYWMLNELLRTVNDIRQKDITTYQSRRKIDDILCEHAPQEMSTPEKNALFNKHVHVIETNEDFDAELSEYAAFVIMTDIGQKYYTIFQQEYFLSETKTLTDIFETVRHFPRIKTRQEIIKYENQLSGIIKQLRNGKYGAFHNYLYKLLFPDTEPERLRHFYRIPDKDCSLTDYMNADLIAAYSAALGKIINTYDALPRSQQKYTKLEQISQTEIQALRNSFTEKDPNDVPEFNMCEKSIDSIIADRKKREQTFINEYSRKGIR